MCHLWQGSARMGSIQSPKGAPHRLARHRHLFNHCRQLATTPLQLTKAWIAGFLPQSTPKR